MRHQLDYGLNLRSLVHSFMVLIINGWTYYSAFYTHKHFGTTRTLPTSVLQYDSYYHSKIHGSREMLAAENPRY